MSHKFILSVGILILSTACIFFFWKNTLLLSFLLMLIAYIKHRIYPIKLEVLWFLLICVGGSIIEILLVNFGHAWKYTDSQLLGIPLWIPLFWGLVGTTIIVLYDSLVNKPTK